MTASEALSPELQFLQRIWRMNHALERRSRRMEKQLGVTAQQRFVLRCLGRHPGITAGQLAAVLHVDPGTLSASLRRLESRGLLERRRDTRDGRRVTLALTEAGRAIDVPSGGTVEASVSALLAALPAVERAAATAVLERFADLLDAP